MTVTLFVLLIAVFAMAVSLITEAVKNLLSDFKLKYSSNMLVLIVALFVGILGTVVAYALLGIPFTTNNIICIGLITLAVWVGAMVGYDKVIQMIEQIKLIGKEG